MVKRVGFIGLGTMGKAMATNVVRAGFDLMVYDLREEPLKELAGLGARVAGSPGEVGRHAEVVEIAVVDDAQVEEVVLAEETGVLTGAQRDSVIAIHSTIHPDTPRKIAPVAAARGVEVVDAQMSGGNRGATAATLCFMVGGSRAAFEKCRPVLEASGPHVFHMGGLGTGSATKLAQQTMVLINMLSAHEGMLLAGKAGIRLETFQELVRVSAGQSSMADHWLRFQEEQRAGGEHRKELFYKGVGPAMDLAHELGTPLPGLALARQLLGRILGMEK
ncbi:MAG TPA: NAD(P)-dependent oxidoreductase [Candidatus Binatia bacterium]